MCGACQVVVQQAEIHSKDVGDGPQCPQKEEAQAEEHLHLQAGDATLLCCSNITLVSCLAQYLEIFIALFMGI